MGISFGRGETPAQPLLPPSPGILEQGSEEALRLPPHSLCPLPISLPAFLVLSAPLGGWEPGTAGSPAVFDGGSRGGSPPWVRGAAESRIPAREGWGGCWFLAPRAAFRHLTLP